MPEIKETGPLTERFDLLNFTDSLIVDLQALRSGRISVKDALARAEIAKQVLRSIGLVVSAQKFLADQAKPMKTLKSTQQ